MNEQKRAFNDDFRKQIFVLSQGLKFVFYEIFFSVKRLFCINKIYFFNELRTIFNQKLKSGSFKSSQ